MGKWCLLKYILIIKTKEKNQIKSINKLIMNKMKNNQSNDYKI